MRLRPKPSTEDLTVDRHLHPVLRSAMECLDVSLEAELARYRRQRPARPGPVQRFFIRNDRPSEVLVEADTSPLPGQAGPPAGLLADPDADLRTGLVAQPGLPGQTAAQLPGQAPLGGNPGPSPPPSPALTDQAPLEVASLLGAAEQRRQGLKGRDRRRARAQSQEPRSPLTGLGVATILMMLSGTIWTYYSNYPASDRWLKLEPLWTKAAESLGWDLPVAIQPILATPAAAPTPAPTPLPPERRVAAVPNLSEQEFVELDLKSLSILEAQRPGETETDRLGSLRLQPPPTPKIVPLTGAKSPRPAASSPSAKSSPALPKTVPLAGPGGQRVPIVTISPDGGRFIYVVGDVTGPNSLERARKVVADAYTRQFSRGGGASPAEQYRIQFGAMPDLNQAKALAERVRLAGIPVEIYLPSNRPEAQPPAPPKAAPRPQASPKPSPKRS